MTIGKCHAPLYGHRRDGVLCQGLLFSNVRIVLDIGTRLLLIKCFPQVLSTGWHDIALHYVVGIQAACCVNDCNLGRSRDHEHAHGMRPEVISGYQ